MAEPSAKSNLAPVQELIGIDARSLAAFRVGLGTMLLWDLGLRAIDLEAHYTDAGVIPATIYREKLIPYTEYWSVHFLGGSLWLQVTLFLIAAIASAAVLAGYRTRIATIVSWVMLVSMQNRNLLLLQGGDDLLRLLVFWSMFLPLGTIWSIDARRGRVPPQKAGGAGRRIICSVATFAILFQVCLMYWFTAALKNHGAWEVERTALEMVFLVDQYTRPIARDLLEYPRLLEYLTAATMLLEKYGPCLVLIPWWNGRFRMLAIAMFFGFHLGIQLTMTLGTFQFICMLAWIPFLPAGFWEWTSTRLNGPIGRMAGVFRLWLDRWIPSKTPGSRNNQRFGRTKSWCGIASQVVAAGLFLFVLLWNTRGLDKSFEKYLPHTWDPFARTLRIDQQWSMFAPYPLTQDGWFVMPARYADGSEVDLITGNSPVDWTKPASVSDTFRNHRWRKHTLGLWRLRHRNRKRADIYAQLYVDYFRRHGDDPRPESVTIYYLKETSLPGRRESEPDRVRLGSSAGRD